MGREGRGLEGRGEDGRAAEGAGRERAGREGREREKASEGIGEGLEVALGLSLVSLYFYVLLQMAFIAQRCCELICQFTSSLCDNSHGRDP